MPFPIGKQPAQPVQVSPEGKASEAISQPKSRASVQLKTLSSKELSSEQLSKSRAKGFLHVPALYQSPKIGQKDSSPVRTSSLRPIKISTAWTGPIGKNDYITQGGTKIEVLLNKDYQPHTTPKMVIPKDAQLFKWLQTRETGYADNVENTNIRKAQTQLFIYAKENPDVMRRFGIKNIQRLSPRQAILISEQIATDISDYNYAAIAKTFSGATPKGQAELAKKMDQWTVDQYFDNDKDGVCRNYAELVQGIFEGLKGLQQPKSESQLVNSYNKQPSSIKHVWNALYTIQPDGVAVVTQVDATWNNYYRTKGEAEGTTDKSKWKNDDYTLGADGVRHYNLLKDLIQDTGSRPLKDFLKTFNNGARLFDSESRSDGVVTRKEMEYAGGTEALSNAISSLPEVLQPEAYLALAQDVRQSLFDYRGAEGLPPIRVRHKKGN